MTIANNPATALEQILRALVESGQPSVFKGWTATLGSQPGTAEFARRHSEVVGLFSRVQSFLNALDGDDPDRRIFGKYVTHWYDAIVFRDSWQASAQPASNVIRPEILDHLAGLGSNLGRRSPEPELTDVRIDQLRQSLAAWRDLLDEAGLPDALSTQIRAQVDHIEWLLANSALFGVSPISSATRDLLGYAIPVATRGKGLRKKIGSAMLGLVLFLGWTDDISEHASTVVTNVVETYEGVQELIDEPSPQKALEVGDTDRQAGLEGSAGE